MKLEKKKKKLTQRVSPYLAKEAETGRSLGRVGIGKRSSLTGEGSPDSELLPHGMWSCHALNSPDLLLPTPPGLPGSEGVAR